MKNSPLVLSIATIALVACTAANVAPKQEAVTSLCELVSSGTKQTGLRVHLKARYKSDFRHSASLLDESCPDASLLVGADSVPRDGSVVEFNRVKGENFLYYRGRSFGMEIVGVLKQEQGVTGTPVRAISIERVVDFEKPAK